eukprot:m.285186 g.285186  ORF g.285186 m.285186 type:complete len:397 (-) comp19430_c6_seq13:367-1557(-)
MSVVENGATVLRDQHGVAADVVTNGEKPAHVGQAAQRHNEAGGTAAGGAAGAAGGVSVTNAAGAAAAAAAAAAAQAVSDSSAGPCEIQPSALPTPPESRFRNRAALTGVALSAAPTGDFDPDAALAHIKSLPFYRNQIVHEELVPARKSEYRGLARPLPSAVAEALQCLGIRELYAHQAQAIDAVRDGRDTVVSTSTSSGKSMTYIVPAIEIILNDPNAVCMFIFPTKALAQDQLRVLRELYGTGFFGDVLVARTLDGFSTPAEREEVKESANIILTNPDMLNATLLPNHTSWDRLFSNLRLVALDEAHMYRGVFGSHVAGILRRLIRLAAARPRFVCCSATLPNPEAHFRALVPSDTSTAAAAAAGAGAAAAGGGSLLASLWQTIGKARHRRDKT